MKILYCDYFHPRNSNLFWKKSFERLGTVQTVNTPIATKAAYKAGFDELYRIDYSNIDHIHFGGSTKLMDIAYIQFIRSKTSAPITIFYGDVYNNSIRHKQLLPFVNRIYLTNNSHLKGEKKASFIVCPYDSQVFHDNVKSSRSKDLVFIGNAHNDKRARSLEQIASMYNLDVYGAPSWEQFKVNYRGAVSYENYSTTLGEYKIALGEPLSSPCMYASTEQGCLKGQTKFYEGLICRNASCPNLKNVEGYFSNRLANTMASKVLHLVYYVPGLEELFNNKEHLVWVKDQLELKKQLTYYLQNESEREQIALNGAEKIKQYSFDQVAKRIIEENK